MPFTVIYKLLGYWPLGPIMCEIWLATDVCLCTASTLGISAIGIDRYLTLKRPFAINLKARAAFLIAAAWLAAVVIALPPLVTWKPSYENECFCDLSTDSGYIIYSTMGTFFIPLAGILLTYCRNSKIRQYKMSNRFLFDS